MKVVNYNSFLDLLPIIKEQARYQKVAVVFDETVSSTDIDEIYRAIKGECVFNKFFVNSDLTELYNGYKLIIFLCSANSFLKANISVSEFVLVFMPIDSSMLPYYLDEHYKKLTGEGYLFLKQGIADACVLPSLYFNTFYNFVNQLIFNDCSNIKFCFDSLTVTQATLKTLLENFDSSLEFVDLKIVKLTGLDYKLLPLVDYVLICAFCCFIEGVKTNNLSLVDVYKAVGDNYELLDNFYQIASNNIVPSLIQLNAFCLQTTAQKSKEKILQNLLDYTPLELEKVIKAVKEYSKNSGDLFTNFYLFNLFDV